jgi:hypothetical protein
MLLLALPVVGRADPAAQSIILASTHGAAHR